MRTLLVVLVATLMACPALAQQSLGEIAAQNKAAADARKAAAAPPSREDVLRLFNLLQIEKTMGAVVAAARQQNKEIGDQMVEDRMPSATPEQKKQVKEMIDGVMQKFLGSSAINEILEASVPVYQHHLTKGDLEAMVAFYSSPVGQKILHEQPAMVQESMEASAGIQQRIARAMSLKIDERMTQMMDSMKSGK